MRKFFNKICMMAFLSVVIQPVGCFGQVQDETPARPKRANKGSRPKDKEVLIRYTEEKLDGKLFVHRVDVVNGTRKERWAIDGDLVAAQDFEELLLDAEKAERRMERRRLEELRGKEEMELAQQQEFGRTSRLAIERKRLNLILGQIETELAKIRDPKLAPYYIFSDTSFANAESFTQLCDELVPQARELCETENVVSEELSKFIVHFEQQPARLRTLFRATVNNAINKCDDTRLLKELLETVA
jgi:hypothetical protein